MTTEGKTRPVVPAEIIKLMQAYGDARADGHLSAPALGEVVVALRDWASAPEPRGKHNIQAVNQPDAQNTGDPATPHMLPDLLFDGYAVMDGLSDQARGRTSWENVSDTLDAIVKLLRAERPAPTKTPRQPGGRIERSDAPHDGAPHDEANCPSCQAEAAERAALNGRPDGV